MNGGGGEAGIGRKLRAVFVLGGACVLFGALLLFTDSSASVRGTPPGPATLAMISNTVDTLFRAYGVDPGLVRTRRILSLEKKPIRIEQRIPVPREFPTLIVNYRLQELLEPAGARVFGTERTKDGVVTFHILAGGVTVRSLAFALGELESPEGLRDSTR